MARLFFVVGLCALINQALAIGQSTCVTFRASNSNFPVVAKSGAAPVLVSSDDWPGVQRAASDFVVDIQRVTGVKASLTNVTGSATNINKGAPVIIGTLGKSSLIDRVINATGLDVSLIRGQWEAFLSHEVQNPLPGVPKAYVIIGADKRGTIYGLYDHSEQFGMTTLCFAQYSSDKNVNSGVSPWYW